MSQIVYMVITKGSCCNGLSFVSKIIKFDV